MPQLTKAEVRDQLRRGIACASCTSLQDRVYVENLINPRRTALSEMTDKAYKRYSDAFEAFVSSVAQRHTCSEFYPTKTNAAHAPKQLEVSVYNDGEQVSYRVVYKHRDNRLYGPGAVTPRIALKEFSTMARRIGE
jgi:F0F1-type ATP synthase gamma subunit